MIIRGYEAKDKDTVIPFLEDKGVIYSPNHHSIIAEEDGKIVGLTVWLDEGSEAYLGYLGTNQGYLCVDMAHNRSINDATYYKMLLFGAREARDSGLTFGYVTIRDKRTLDVVERLFDVYTTVQGREPLTQTPKEWNIRFSLENIVKQLEVYANVDS